MPVVFHQTFQMITYLYLLFSVILTDNLGPGAYIPETAESWASTSIIGSFQNVGCDVFIYLDATYIVPASYQASEEIIATGILLNGQSEFQAGESIILGSGFEVKPGATLDVRIAPCNL